MILRVMIPQMFSNISPNMLKNDPVEMCMVKLLFNPENFLLIYDNRSH